MTYDEMMDRFGSDKPDLRYGMELADLADRCSRAPGSRRSRRCAADGGAIKALAAPGGGQLSRKELDKLVEDAKGRGAAGLVWMVVEDDGAVRSPVEKFLSPEEIAGHRSSATGAAEGDLICIVADRADRANVALDGLRRRPRRSPRPDPRGRVGVLLDDRAAAVRVVRRGGQVGLGAPPVHLAGDRRPRARDREGPRATTWC